VEKAKRGSYIDTVDEMGYFRDNNTAQHGNRRQK
jgi:hypothetical protein